MQSPVRSKPTKSLFGRAAVLDPPQPKDSTVTEAAANFTDNIYSKVVPEHDIMFVPLELDR